MGQVLQFRQDLNSWRRERAALGSWTQQHQKKPWLKSFWERTVEWFMPRPIHLVHALGSPAREMLYCALHRVWDDCIQKHGCRGQQCDLHNSMTHTRKETTIVMHSTDHTWARPIVPRVSQYVYSCGCDCHKDFRKSDTCGSYCCKKRVEDLAKVTGASQCLCLCHRIKELGCSGSMVCCKDSCSIGETDEEPLDITPSNVYPWTSTIGSRRRSMADTMHLHMTVEGPPAGIDLFHIILFKCDKEYPRDPMAKAGTKIKKCTKCNGIVWPNMIFKPEEVVKAAKDASLGVGGKVEVRVHSWRKASKCFKKGGREELVAL